MVEENTAVAVAEPKTEAQLLEEMTSATKSGDFKLVAKVAGELVKFQKAKEAAEQAAIDEALKAVTLEVGNAIKAAVAPFIKAGKLDKADGIWFSQDFGEKLETIRLRKNVTKAKGSGGGGGKKYNVNTSELLEKYGSEEFKDGQTFSQAWESNTDKNWRYGIREKLLKRDGVTS